MGSEGWGLKGQGWERARAQAAGVCTLVSAGIRRAVTSEYEDLHLHASIADWQPLGLQVQKAQKGLSLDPDADWAGEANRLIQSWQAVQQKEAGSSGPADKQAGGSKPHAQGGKGQQQQQSKKQTKRQKRQAQQQQQAKQQKQEQQAQQQQQAKQQEQQQQPKQEQQQQSSSQQHKRPREEASSDGASGSAAHGQYSYTYGPQGQRTESAEPWMNSPPAEHFDWLSAGMLPRCAWHVTSSKHLSDGDALMTPGAMQRSQYGSSSST